MRLRRGSHRSVTDLFQSTLFVFGNAHPRHSSRTCADIVGYEAYWKAVAPGYPAEPMTDRRVATATKWDFALLGLSSRL